MSLVISGFPGVGKTHYYNIEKELRVSDSDSSQFDKKDFPNNYIQHIKKLIKQEYDVILVSSHESVRRALNKEKISHVVVMPRTDEKEEYIRRYKERGSSADFIDMMASSWDVFMNSMHLSDWEIPYGIECLLNPGKYLDRRTVDVLLTREAIQSGKANIENIINIKDENTDSYDVFEREFVEKIGISVEDFEGDQDLIWIGEEEYDWRFLGDLLFSFYYCDGCYNYRLDRIIKEEEKLPEDICMCDCHRVGLAGFYHCFGLVCCEYENEQYLETERGILNVELYREMLKRKAEDDRMLNRKRKNRKSV